MHTHMHTHAHTRMHAHILCVHIQVTQPITCDFGSVTFSYAHTGNTDMTIIVTLHCFRNNVTKLEVQKAFLGSNGVVVHCHIQCV